MVPFWHSLPDSACGEQVIKVLEVLPLTADDMYTLTSAQGCLVDTLASQQLDTEVCLRPPAQHSLPARDMH